MSQIAHRRIYMYTLAVANRSLRVGVVALLLTLPLIGCASFVPPPTMSDDPFKGPPASLTFTSPNHVVAFEAPTPGWSATLTRVLPGPGRQDAFVTLRKPFPGVIYAQVVVTQRVATGVPTSDAINVYARIVEHDENPAADDPYTLAASSPGTPRTPIAPK